MITITAHQTNYLPGLSVIEKIESADACIWLDEVQYTKGGYTNRNRLPDGSWLTVPVLRVTDGLPINRVRITEHGLWRRRHVRAIRQHYGGGPLIDAVCREIERPYRMLTGLNVALLQILVPDVVWAFQSHLDDNRPLVAVSQDRHELGPISARLAMMVAELGGDVYLSGPSGFRYLDEQPFRERGIKVKYFEWTQPDNPCVLIRAAADQLVLRSAS